MTRDQQAVIHLYLTSLPDVPDSDTLACAIKLLSEDEIRRAEGMSRENTRQGFILVRAQVRRWLARHTGLAPEALVFTRSTTGKPALEPAGLSFNISHSRQHLALVLGTDTDLGVDLEVVSRRGAWRALSQRYFHPEEAAWLQTLPDAEGQYQFYRLWTLKEALLKARGTGIATGLDRFKLDFHGQAIALAVSPLLQETLANWRLWQWSWTPDVILALASRSVRTRPLQVEFHVQEDTPTLLGSGPVLPA